MAVDDFLRVLDSIEAEIQEVPDILFVEMSLTRGRIGNTKDTISTDYRHISLLTSRSVRAHWEELYFDIGGPGFPFVWSLENSALHESFPQDLMNEAEPVEFAVWFYLDSLQSPIPKHLLDEFSPDENCFVHEFLGPIAYQTEINRAMNVMRAMREAWSMAPEAVISEFGDLSKLPTGSVLPVGEGDSFDLWWPTALLYLALQKVDVVLSARAKPYKPFDSILGDLPEDGDHQTHDPTTRTVSLSLPSLKAATLCMLRAFRRVAKDSIKKSSTLLTDSRAALRSKQATLKVGNLLNNSDSIAASKFFKSLVNDVAKKHRLIEVWKSFAQRNETNADHDWGAWIERLNKVAGELDAAGETTLARQLRMFYRQIDGRNETTSMSNFRFEIVNKWPVAKAGQTGGDGTPREAAHELQPSDAKLKWNVPMLEGYVFALLKEVEYPKEREAVKWIANKSRRPEPSRTTLRKTFAWQNRPLKTPKPRTTNEAQSGVSPAQNEDTAVSHEVVMDTVLDIEEKLCRKLADDERAAVAWTLQQIGADKKKQDEQIRQLIQGFSSNDM